MNHVCRQRWVAVCLLFALFAGAQASAQQFLKQEIIDAEKITDEMRAEILAIVAPAAKELTSAEPKAVTKARASGLAQMASAEAMPA